MFDRLSPGRLFLICFGTDLFYPPKRRIQTLMTVEMHFFLINQRNPYPPAKHRKLCVFMAMMAVIYLYNILLLYCMGWYRGDITV